MSCPSILLSLSCDRMWCLQMVPFCHGHKQCFRRFSSIFHSAKFIPAPSTHFLYAHTLRDILSFECVTGLQQEKK